MLCPGSVKPSQESKGSDIRFRIQGLYGAYARACFGFGVFGLRGFRV